MREWLLSGVVLAALGLGPATAADIPLKAPPPPAPSAYNWTGFFTGGSIGGQSWDISGIYATPPPDRHHTDGSSGVYGAHIGAQYQANGWVMGVEAAFNSPFDRSYST